MARYHFDLEDCQGLTADDEGLELPTAQAAQEEAARTLAELARDTMRRPAKRLLPYRMVLQVRDANGPVLRVSCTIEIE
jgi:hypothetical protein